MIALLITIIGTLHGAYYYDLIPYLIGALIGELIVFEWVAFKIIGFIEKQNKKIDELSDKIKKIRK